MDSKLSREKQEARSLARCQVLKGCAGILGLLEGIEVRTIAVALNSYHTAKTKKSSVTSEVVEKAKHQ